MTSSYGKNSSVPCGKDMYSLAQYLKKNYDISVTVLTAGYDDNAILAGESDEIDIVNLPTNKEWREKIALEYYQNKNIISKVLLRLELRKLNHKMERDYFEGTAINYKNLWRWLCERKQETYDLILSVSYPFYIQRYAYMVRKHLKIRKWIMYLLDPYADNVHIYKDTRKRRIREERRLFKSCTNIFAAEELVTKQKYSPIIDFRTKVNYIPTHLLTNNTEYTYVRCSNEVNFVYAGTFYSDIRNPEELLKLFLHLPNHYTLSLYSVGCEDVIEKYKELLGERLEVNGFVVGYDEYKKRIEMADILVDVGNTVSNQVPSKLLDYCSYGKPIVHFINCNEEVVGERFAKYPLFLNIEYGGDYDNVSKRIIEFCENSVGRKVDYTVIQKYFKESTVEYVSELIGKILIHN